MGDIVEQISDESLHQVVSGEQKTLELIQGHLRKQINAVIVAIDAKQVAAIVELRIAVVWHCHLMWIFQSWHRRHGRLRRSDPPIFAPNLLLVLVGLLVVPPSCVIFKDLHLF